MPRTVSSAAMQAVLAQETDKVFLVLLEIDHASLGSPIRLVNNTTDITSNGDLYTAYPFNPKLPNDNEDREPVASIVIDNVDRALIDEVRTIQGSLTMTMSVILADTPNTIEWGPLTMDVRGVTYDATKISFQVGLQSLSKEPFPYRTFNPVDFPGLFK